MSAHNKKSGGRLVLQADRQFGRAERLEGEADARFDDVGLVLDV